MYSSFTPSPNVKLLAALLACLAGGVGFGQVVEPSLPKAVPKEEEGFFPTQAESPLLRGAYDSRSWGNASSDGPDLRMQSAADLFPYQDQSPNFYQRNPGLFQNMDHLLGVFTPNDAWTLESDRLRHTALTFDANLGLLTRTFSPDLATLKAGPLYFDLLYIGAGAIWSDFNGNSGTQAQKTDGFISNLNMGIRGLVRLTDTLYLSAAAQLMYLPQSNEFAFSLGYGRGAAFAVDLVYGDAFGPWDVRFTNHFMGRPGINFFASVQDPGAEQAGNYWFGIRENNAPNNGNFYTNNGAFFSNSIGLSATRLVLGGSWRFWSSVNHTDFWQTFDFTHHRQREHFGVWLGYEGSIIPFAPKFSYDAWTFDEFDSIWHRVAMTLRGRITENIKWNGMAGYLFNTGESTNQGRFLWSMQFTQNLSPRTTHGIGFGEGFFLNDYTNDALTARYANYRITHAFARNLNASLFLQISDHENYVSTGSLNSGSSTERAGGGASLTYQPLDFTSISASILHDESLKPTNLSDRWITRLTVSQQLGIRMTGSLFYQYRENSGLGSSFTEHAIGLSLRRYF